MSSFAERFMTKTSAPAAAAAMKLDGPHPANTGWKWIGRCPACAEAGNDTQGNHLTVFDGGQFACIRFPGDSGTDHRRKMAELCPALRGGKSTGPVFAAPDLSKEKESLKAAALAMFEGIKSALAGDIESIGESARIDEDPRWQFAAFCDLFRADDLVWVGHLKDAGPIGSKRNNITGLVEWWETKPHRLFSRHLFRAGDMGERERIFRTAMADRCDLTRGIAWKPGSQSRQGENVAARRFAVVEHDEVSKADQVALIRYVKDVLKWPLLMVIDTTGKSIHGLFDVSSIPPDLGRLQVQTLINMGVDPNALNNSATRAPGLTRQPNPDKPNKPHGDRQRILWLAPSTTH
jgi:hypothetical protein